jgi:hypothetical protein
VVSIRSQAGAGTTLEIDMPIPPPGETHESAAG